MRRSQRDGIGQRLRMYSVALGFVIGQIGPLTPTPPRQPPAIVRTRAADLDRRGFDDRERIPGRFVLTTPHVLIAHGHDPKQVEPQVPERTWIRNN